MGLFFDAPVSLEDAISFTQEQPIPSNNMLTQLFPRRDFDTDTVEFDELFQTNRTVKFRNWDGSFATVPRDSGEQRRVKRLPLGGTLEQGEYERRQIEHARTGGTFQRRLVDAIYNDLELLTRYAFNRIELAWGDVLNDGKLTINENNVVQECDFSVPAGNKVTAGTLWSDKTNSTPLTDLRNWTAAYAAANSGMRPGRVLTTLPVIYLLMENKQLINAIKGDQTGVTLVSLVEINSLLASFGLPMFDVPDIAGVNGGSLYESNLDVDGATVSVLNQDNLLLLPSDLGELGFTAWGTPTTAYELNEKNVQTSISPGMVGIIVREDNPPFRKNTYVDAVGMPILSRPKKLFIAKVK